ncbi:translation initiation factor IF-5A [Candidatus Woesearchaeota archaeon]|nr:translation initiation factor IF-5A [Candidatus Woesearchaeota archaeon]
MADIKHKSAGTMQKGNYVVIDGVASIVTDVKISRPGKHGHAKVNLTAVGMLDDKKRNIVVPGHDNLEVPIIEKKNAQVLSVTGETCNVMEMETYETFDLKIPGELKGQVAEGQTVVYWSILNDRVLKQIKNEGE